MRILTRLARHLAVLAVLAAPSPLAVLFVALKLTHVLAWSWWWVTAPFWAPYAALLLVFLVTLSVAVVAAYRDQKRIIRYSIRHD